MTDVADASLDGGGETVLVVSDVDMDVLVVAALDNVKARRCLFLRAS